MLFACVNTYFYIRICRWIRYDITFRNTFNVSCGDGQYVYFAIPTRFGTPTFSVGGFSGGFVKVSTLDFTNKFGYTEPYDIWKSENSNLGKITVVVG